MIDQYKKVQNVFVAVSLLTRILSDNDDGSMPHEVAEYRDGIEDIVRELELGHRPQQMESEDIKDVIECSIKLANAVTADMLHTLDMEDPISVFHQSLVLALMDLDRNLIAPGMESPDDLSEAMLQNREKLLFIYEMLDSDPSLLDSID